MLDKMYMMKIGSGVDHNEIKGQIRNPAGVRPKGWSNARLKSHFEKTTKRLKKKLDSKSNSFVNPSIEEPKEINFIGSSTFKGESDSAYMQFPTSYYKNDDFDLSLPFEFCYIPDVSKC